VLDFDMLQTGHGDRRSIPNTIRLVREAYETRPTLPVINGEVCYEGIGEACRQEVQRCMFWICMLSGACGHTYGANGIWQVNRQDDLFGPSPHGRTWGNTLWDEAARLPGSGQVGLAKGFLSEYEWWRFGPHPEWVEPAATEESPFAAYAGGIPGEVRMIFLPSGTWGITAKEIEEGVDYRAFLFSPVDGSRVELGDVRAENGEWKLETPSPIFQDWVVVLEAAKRQT
jgi:hypothetical protein